MGNPHLRRHPIICGTKVSLPPRRDAVVTLPVLDGGGRDAHRSSRLSDAAECFDDIFDARHNPCDTTFAHRVQEECMTFALARSRSRRHQRPMKSAGDILAALAERKVTHQAIAQVLGVTTPNATKLYNPATKTGKPRKLSFDEGIKLIEAFGLSTAPAIPPLSEPVARLVVQYFAVELGARLSPEDDRVQELAQDMRAFSRFAADPRVRSNVDRTQGFFEGLHRSERRVVR